MIEKNNGLNINGDFYSIIEFHTKKDLKKYFFKKIPKCIANRIRYLNVCLTLQQLQCLNKLYLHDKVISLLRGFMSTYYEHKQIVYTKISKLCLSEQVIPTQASNTYLCKLYLYEEV